MSRVMLNAIVFLETHTHTNNKKGAAFFALEFPQRLLPGQLDFIGQGHHFFHVFIFMALAKQLDAVYDDFERNRALIVSSRPPPTVLYCFASLAVLCAYYFYMMRSFNRMIAHNFDSNGSFLHDETKNTTVPIAAHNHATVNTNTTTNGATSTAETTAVEQVKKDN